MKLPLRRRDKTSRGQALVEFAILLPVLALLLVMTVDLGRVFFGWVALTNVARTGANYAAVNPTAWANPGDASKRAVYVLRMQQDAQAINCTLPSTLPSPSFIDANGNGQTMDLNDLAKVRLTCGFTLLTPLAGNILGNPLVFGAEALFPIRTGIIGSLPVNPGLPTPTPTPTPVPTAAPCTVPPFIGDAKNATAIRAKWATAGFVSPQNITITGGNWTIVGSQSVQGNTSQPCLATSITVGP